MTDNQIPEPWMIEGFLREVYPDWDDKCLKDHVLLVINNPNKLLISIHGARIYGQLHEHPEDKGLMLLRETLARYEEGRGYGRVAEEMRSKKRDDGHIEAALAYLRGQGVEI